MKRTTLFIALGLLLTGFATADSHNSEVTIETESGTEIEADLAQEDNEEGFISRAAGYAEEQKHIVPGINREPVSRQDLIMMAKIDSTKLSQEEIGAISGVPPVSVSYSEITVGELIEKARDRRKKTNWNRYANEAVASVGVYDHSSGPIEVKSPEDVNINGHTFVVSSDGYVFTEGQSWAAPHCWEDKSFQPPEFDESLVPQFDPDVTDNPSNRECPSWVNEENLEWLPSSEKLARVETYCPDIVGDPTATELENRPNINTADELERIYYEGGENAVVDVECVEDKLVEACGRGEPNNYCKKMNVKLCNYFDANCGKAEDVTVADGKIWMEECREDTDTSTFEGKKSCITETVGPECAGDKSGGCQQVMRSLCSYLDLGYNPEENLCEAN